MKAVTLRTLVWEPLKVKRWTRNGESVRVTDHGKPLWILQAAGTAPHEEGRRRATVEILEQVLRERPSRVSAAPLLEESRR